MVKSEIIDQLDYSNIEEVLTGCPKKTHKYLFFSLKKAKPFSEEKEIIDFQAFRNRAFLGLPVHANILPNIPWQT